MSLVFDVIARLDRAIQQFAAPMEQSVFAA
jgi:hypothetical protein